MRTRGVGHAAAVLTLAVALVGGPALSAAADEPIPGPDEVRRAQQHTSDVAARVEAIRVRLRQSQQRAEAAAVALSQAAESYNQAEVRLAAAEKAARAAQAGADAAGERLDGAQQEVGKLAAQAYRNGGNLAGLEVLLSPKGPDEVLERASMIQVVAGQRQRTVRRADSARVVARSLAAQAEEALERRQAAADALAAAKEIAEQRSVVARQALAADTVQRNALLTELAEARRTSVEIERRRQEGLRRQADERREAEARRTARRAGSDTRPETRPATRSEDDRGGPGGSSSGSSGSSSGSGGSSSGSTSAGASAVEWAKDRLGLPYQWGGEGPGSYDCSGLTMRAWAQAGVSLPHSSRLQYQSVQHVSYSSLRPGDLVFFGSDRGDPESIHHVAMYVGGGQMIEAPYTGASIRIVALRTSGAMPYAGRV